MISILCLIIIAILILKPEQWLILAKKLGTLFGFGQNMVSQIKNSLHEQNLQQTLQQNIERANAAEQKQNRDQ